MNAPEPRPERPQIQPAYLGGKEHDTDTVTWSSVQERLAAARNYWIASVRAGGRPHAMPVWAVVIDGDIHFSTDAGSVKGRNLGARPDCVVHLESGDDVVIVDGRAERVTDAEALRRFVDAYRLKYDITVDTADPAFSVFAVRPRSVLGWVEKDFPGTATRWRLEG